MASIKLEIVSPDKMVYSDDVEMAIVHSTGGELGIMPNHAPLLTGILPHAMHVKKDSHEELIAIAGGFMEVSSNKITILASAAELPINIDINRAQKAYARAQERLESLHQSPDEHKDIDSLRAHAALERAKARLQATKTID
ncbi:F0F1 ATP synthase subunit epsilon [Pectinatus brassicae]|uniref:ATP synthase epsilon chain n=1 Tax=Pectinatus brassicae TaxID=862415 RepID=A0A840UQL4_9FIRM|nr:F0F1 ATP synthase subunit epsilon [Pectinatus brassicae]MBB5337008.1 F-type H+-transporting ATPase subunit epsilon [Pectinatus brassicae]